MKQPAFVHLRVHSEYSIQDGIVRLDDAVQRAVADAMPALALTDLANMFGLVKFYQAARGAGVKPILGCDAWLANTSDRDKPFRILLLAQNRAGYHRLCELLSLAYRTNQHRGRAEVAKPWFGELGSEGLIALSGAQLGDVGHALLAGNATAAESLVREWAALFPGRFYLEVQRYGTTEAESQRSSPSNPRPRSGSRAGSRRSCRDRRPAAAPRVLGKAVDRAYVGVP